jgi:DNA-binding CsgD family transcriptional regulator
MGRRGKGSISRDAVIEAIGEIWKSSADSENWKSALSSIRRLAPECMGMVIYTPFSQGGNGTLWQTLDAPNGFLEDYVANWQGRDICLHAIARRMPVEKLVVDLSDVIPEPETSEYWQKLCRPHGIEDMTVLAVNGMRADGVEAALLGAFATERNRLLARAHKQALTTIQDHLLGAVALHWRLVRAETSASVSRSLLERIALGMVILSASAKVLYMNAAARRMVDEGDAVRMKDNRIEAVHPGAQQRIEKALAAIVRGGAERPFLLPRKLGAMKAAGMVTAIMSPVEAGVHLGDLGKAGAILFLSDPRDVARGAGSRLAELYGLTRAEAEVAQAIAEGCDPQEISVRRRITVNTARTQIKAVMRKVGATRQSDVVRAVLATVVLDQAL